MLLYVYVYLAPPPHPTPQRWDPWCPSSVPLPLLRSGHPPNHPPLSEDRGRLDIWWYLRVWGEISNLNNCNVQPLYSGHPWGTKFWPLHRGGLYWGVVLYTNCSFGTCVPGRYTEVAFIQGWPLIKRGSTVQCKRAPSIILFVQSCRQNKPYYASVRMRKRGTYTVVCLCVCL